MCDRKMGPKYPDLIFLPPFFCPLPPVEPRKGHGGFGHSRHDLAGEVQTDSQSVPGLTPTVSLSESYTLGNRTQVSANIGNTADFVNNYTYGGVMGQMSQVTQQAQAGGDSVAAKTATFRGKRGQNYFPLDKGRFSG
jgi:hypothetical protein